MESCVLHVLNIFRSLHLLTIHVHPHKVSFELFFQSYKCVKLFRFGCSKHTQIFVLACLSETVIASDVATTTVEVISEPPAEVNVNDRQIVTFPNHFQVSEALKSGLTFGSFESTFGSSVKSIGGTDGDNDSSGAAESSQQTDQTAKEHSRLVNVYFVVLD